MPAQIIVMTRTKISICLLSGLLLTGCSTVTVPELAPESVAGRIICLDDRFTQICERPIEGGQWSAWTDFKYGCVFDFPFDANNQYRTALNPSETTCQTYKKTGPDSAEIYYESAESTHTCYLKFETPTSGTATKEGYGEGNDYKQRGMLFSIK